ncbi:MAG: TolC family protein [Candidatus Margulisbacteria bacterium]|nr:TolC family protein [Candidatus Margulisiibacteriota bacterium]
MRYTFIIFSVLLLIFSSALAEEAQLDLSILLKKAEQNNPEIKALEAEIKKQEENVKYTEGDWIPDIRIGGNVYHDDEVAAQHNTTSFSLGITKWFSQGNRIQMAKESLEIAKARLDLLKLQLENEISSVYEDYVLSLKKLEIQKRNYDASLATFNTMKKMLGTGDISPDRMISAQNSLAQYEQSIEIERANKRKTMRKLKELVGGQL